MGITDEAVWRAEYTPAALKAFGTRVGAKLGCTVYYKGDTAHRRGRHRSRNWSLYSAYCTNRSYGTTDARDKRGPGDATRACDVMIAGDVLEKVSRGIDDAVRAGRLPELAEWFGTFNSVVVVGWFEGHAASSDSSHLTHLHLGVWTQFVDLAAFYDRLFDAMMTYIDGGDMTPEQDSQVIAGSLKGGRNILHARLRALQDSADPVLGEFFDDKTTAALKAVPGLKQLGDRLTALEKRPPVVASPVDPAALKAVLLDPQVLAAIAKAVADEDHARSAG